MKSGAAQRIAAFFVVADMITSQQNISPTQRPLHVIRAEVFVSNITQRINLIRIGLSIGCDVTLNS
jgi:hypothetical protein